MNHRLVNVIYLSRTRLTQIKKNVFTFNSFIATKPTEPFFSLFFLIFVYPSDATAVTKSLCNHVGRKSQRCGSKLQQRESTCNFLLERGVASEFAAPYGNIANDT